MIRKMIIVLQMALMLPLMPLMGAIKVKDITKSAEKWGTNAAQAASEFAANAEAAADDWARNTAASADNYHQAVSAANVKERFRRGVMKAGAAKFARKIRDVAANRFSSGVSVAVDDYKAGVEPYLSALAGITLSPRAPRGDPRNYRRVEEVGKVLNAKRISMLGGGG